MQGAAATLPTQQRRMLRPGELVLAADRDDIPPIFADAALFVAAGEADAEWDDGEYVVGVEFAGEARAYPVRLLSLHEVVNDDVGGMPLVVTWCPLCYSAIVFDRRGDPALTFAASGYLYRNNLVMVDHQTGTLWSQALGLGLRGAQRGVQLDVLPSTLTTWESWKNTHSGTRILSAVRLGAAPGSLVDPYTSYYRSGAAGLTGRSNPDQRLPIKELVVGISIGESHLAIPLLGLAEAGWTQFELGGLPLVAFHDPQNDAVGAYVRRVGERTLAFGVGGSGAPEDLETGSTWDVSRGTAVTGPLRNASMQRVPVTQLFWFAWIDLHPTSELHLIP